MNTAISKITERGQITLPHKMRRSSAFAHARAVIFTQEGDSLRVTALKHKKPASEHAQILNATMRDWLDPINDDLFDFS